MKQVIKPGDSRKIMANVWTQVVVPRLHAQSPLCTMRKLSTKILVTIGNNLRER